MDKHPDQKRAEALEYIITMLGQLRMMADEERFDMVAYLIEMAYVEANDVVSGHRPSCVCDQEGDGAA